MARPAGHPINRAAWDYVLTQDGRSVTQIADESDIKRATLSSLLGRFHRASVPMAHRIAAAVDCDPKVIFPTLSPQFLAIPDEELEDAS